MKPQTVGHLENYYANGISLLEKDGIYYWGLKDYDEPILWEEITKALYDELLKHKNGDLKTF